MTDRFTDNTDESRFELHVDGHLAVPTTIAGTAC